jgi:TRAP-type mannitol/chloroaromatic compound transport system permease small subunit
MKNCLSAIDNISRWSGRIVSPLVLVMMCIVIYEVVSRFFFNKPTIWVHETSTWLWGIGFLIAGAYAFLENKMVNVEIVRNRLPTRARAAVDVFSFLPLLITCGVLIWYGSEGAWKSIELHEHSMTVFAPPLYVLKSIVPVGGFLVLLQGLAKLTRDLHVMLTGRVLQ